MVSYNGCTNKDWSNTTTDYNLKKVTVKYCKPNMKTDKCEMILEVSVVEDEHADCAVHPSVLMSLVIMSFTYQNSLTIN